VDRDAVELRALAQELQEAAMVIVVAEDGLVVVAALEDVVRLVGQDEAGLAGHGR
jgi:predicted regulator of Ras-like GTPase activity (Roadblock/LC7/MglB family)